MCFVCVFLAFPFWSVGSLFTFCYLSFSGFPGSSADKESACNAGDPGWFLGQDVPLEKGKATHSSILGLPGGSDGKESAYNAGKPGFNPWVGKIPWRRVWQPTPVLLPGESPWTGSRCVTVHGVAELDTTKRLSTA